VSSLVTEYEYYCIFLFVWNRHVFQKKTIVNIFKFTLHSLILAGLLCVILLIVLSRFRARWHDRLKANVLVEPQDKVLEERRQDSRLKSKIPVLIDTLEGTIEARTKDISRIGAFIVCQNPLPIKRTFRITLLFPEHESIVFDAEVVWNNSNFPEDKIVCRGMGIRFIKLSHEDRRFLEEVLVEQPD
jgi:hypothetical protein